MKKIKEPIYSLYIYNTATNIMNKATIEYLLADYYSLDIFKYTKDTDLMKNIQNMVDFKLCSALLDKGT